MQLRAKTLTRTFSSLANRNYRLFFAGQVISLVGTWMQRVSQDWLILELTDSAVAVSIGVALQFAPVMVFGVLGGLVVDRLDTRRVLLWAQWASAALALALGLLTLVGVVQLWMVFTLAFALGCVTVLEQPARHSFVSELVGSEGVANAVSLNSSMNNIARLIGPAIAGFLITAVGTGWTFLVNGLSFFAVVAGLLAMDTALLIPKTPVSRLPGQAREGLRYAAEAPAVRAPLVLIFVISTFSQHFRIILPLMASDVFGKGAETYGTLMAMLGMGALGGALACAHYARPSQRMLIGLAGGFGVVSLVAAGSPSLAVLTAMMILVGAGNTSFNTTATALVQLRSDAAFRGRVQGLRGIVSVGTTPLGAPLIGWVCETHGVRAGLAAGGVVAIVAALVALPTRRLDRRGASEHHADDDVSPVPGGRDAAVRGV